MVEEFEDPIEEAKYYCDQMNHSYLTPGEIGQKMGKDRAQIEATIQLLRLPAEIQNYVHQGLLQKEHGVVLAWGDENPPFWENFPQENTIPFYFSTYDLI